MSKPKIFFLTAFIFLFNLLSAMELDVVEPTKAIIFDIHGVLLDLMNDEPWKEKIEFFRKKYGIQDSKNIGVNCEVLIDSILKNNCPLCDDFQKCPWVVKNSRLSHFLYWWQYGCAIDEYSSVEKQNIKSILEGRIDKSFGLLNNNVFYNPHFTDNGKLFLCAMAKYFYSSQRYFDMSELIPQGVDLLNYFKDKGYRLFILSNAPPNVYEGYKQKFPEVFNFFEGAIISGDVGLMKPDKIIFEMLLKQYNLRPEDCIFIDDKLVQVKGARACGITGIHFNLNDFGEAFEDLRNLGVMDGGHFLYLCAKYPDLKERQSIKKCPCPFNWCNLF